MAAKEANQKEFGFVLNLNLRVDDAETDASSLFSYIKSQIITD